MIFSMFLKNYYHKQFSKPNIPLIFLNIFILLWVWPSLALYESSPVRPEKFQFMEKGKNRNFDYKIVITVKNP